MQIAYSSSFVHDVVVVQWTSRKCTKKCGVVLLINLLFFLFFIFDVVVAVAIVVA